MSEEKTPVAAPAAPWFDGLSPELIGVAQTRGWHELDAAAAAKKVLESYRALETRMGVPPEQLVKLPAKPEHEDPESWKAIWQRLGASAEPADYVFPEGVSEDLQTLLRAQAASLGLPKGKAIELAAALDKHQKDQAAGAAKLAETSRQAEDMALKADWGRNYEVHLHTARQGATAVGVNAEQLAALEQSLGMATTMKIFQNIGSRLGEDKFVTGGVGSSNILTREQAIAKRADLMRDATWRQRWSNREKSALDEMHSLNVIIASDE